jgi:hypothetical protein
MQYTHLLYPTYCFVVSLLSVHIFWAEMQKASSSYDSTFMLSASRAIANSLTINSKNIIEKICITVCYKYICTVTNIVKHVFCICE